MHPEQTALWYKQMCACGTCLRRLAACAEHSDRHRKLYAAGQTRVAATHHMPNGQNIIIYDPSPENQATSSCRGGSAACAEQQPLAAGALPRPSRTGCAPAVHLAVHVRGAAVAMAGWGRPQGISIDSSACVWCIVTRAMAALAMCHEFMCAVAGPARGQQAKSPPSLRAVPVMAIMHGLHGLCPCLRCSGWDSKRLCATTELALGTWP